MAGSPPAGPGWWRSERIQTWGGRHQFVARQAPGYLHVGGAPSQVPEPDGDGVDDGQGGYHHSRHSAEAGQRLRYSRGDETFGPLSGIMSGCVINLLLEALAGQSSILSASRARRIPG